MKIKSASASQRYPAHSFCGMPTIIFDAKSEAKVKAAISGLDEAEFIADAKANDFNATQHIKALFRHARSPFGRGKWKFDINVCDMLAYTLEDDEVAGLFSAVYLAVIGGGKDRFVILA
jgi:hypothetical protein